MQLLVLIATGATVLASLRTVQGHAYMVEPECHFEQGYPSNGFGSTINNTKFAEFDGAATGNYSQPNIIFFKRAFESTKEKNMGAFITRFQELYSNEIDPECGLTSYKESERSELPEEIIYTGFTHPGPCEIWCDDTKLLFDDDCQKTYPKIPAKIPYDKSKCANANRVTIYWIALQSSPWQVYTHCAWLVGGSGRGSAPSAVGKGSSTPAADDTASPTPTTNTPPSTAEGEDLPPPASGSYAPSSTPTTTPDAPTEDTPTPDAPTPDAPTPDAPTPDAPTPDAPTPDAPTPDAPTPDAPTPDAPSSYAPTPDTPTPVAPTPVAPATEAPTVSTPTPGAKCNHRRRN